jgi:formyltetrahydrofolate-dependent phosphoribosylglycinamide formyltransferase
MRQLQVGVLISGGGRTLLNLLDCIEEGSLQAEIPVVISSLAKARGVERARDRGLHVEIVRRKDFDSVEAFSRKITDVLEAHHVELACLAGWTCFWQIPERWLGRVMNIHPALLPKYGGAGFFGHHVHEAVLAAGETESGCTVHFANNEYDAGPIILQRKVPVQPDDDPDSLAARVFEQECVAYPEAIRLFSQDRLRIVGDRVEVR